MNKETAKFPLLEVRGVKKHFPIKKGFFNKVVGQIKAVDGVSFELYSGECLGLVGESGSGKTTVGRTILRALKPTAGEVIFQINGKSYDLASLETHELRPLRRYMQMIFQDPYSSLNPRMTVAEIIGEPLLVNGMVNNSERENIICDLLEQVGLKTEHLRRYPHAFSGGQRQRIGIARALALKPKLIVADEPVSALDVSVQAQVLNLLQDLQSAFKLTYLFIAHDLSVVGHISDRIAVMYAGRLVELGSAREIMTKPNHPYTEALLEAVPMPDPIIKPDRQLLSGEVADPSNLPTGCVFHPRCSKVEERCRVERPDLREISPGNFSRCHLS
ncbi:dipeptide/oligopeptide/nickel ABC transporter ATP-binding protein [Candidatus Poribacteria bacterium]|nr:dipeptide/oligopeptide/nickel ABC transporter ATP-binding protein [Candidatus Poribacteria bacterium]MEE2909480.1 oligopeptide/dipeptide ABC transporter ATP-binding protein [Candidatus Poribacteria bacterium]